jgi:hydrogenase nickel incorporation protein HypA/HybF
MHELSICQSLVDAVLAELTKLDSNVRLRTTRVVVGGLRQVVPEYLQQAYEVLTKETPAQGSALEVKNTPVIGQCEDCGWQGELSKGGFACRKCASPSAQITGGMELYLESLEIEED